MDCEDRLLMDLRYITLPPPFFFRQLKKRFSLEVLTNERTAHKGRTRFSSQLFLYRCESKWRLREVLVADDS